MKQYCFKQAMEDHSLFYKRDGDDITMLFVYVDDMILTASNPNKTEASEQLSKEFKMKDLRALKYLLGIEVSQSKHRLFLSQRT